MCFHVALLADLNPCRHSLCPSLFAQRFNSHLTRFDKLPLSQELPLGLMNLFISRSINILALMRPM